eukprot:9035108-Alexandrium_andersonii.AAC.2
MFASGRRCRLALAPGQRFVLSCTRQCHFCSASQVSVRRAATPIPSPPLLMGTEWATELTDPLANCRRPVRLVSACTGLFSEHRACKMLRMPCSVAAAYEKNMALHTVLSSLLDGAEQNNLH